MKTLVPLTWICAAALASAAPETSPWQWQQDADIPAAGISRLEIPPATLDVSQLSLADLRLIDPDGVETPWLMDEQAAPRVTDIAASDFKATLEGRSTVLTASHEAGAIEAITLQSPSREFLKSPVAEGSRDGIDWTPLATAEVVFRQSGGASRLHIPLGPGAWPKLRVTLDDSRTQPVPFTGIQVTPVGSKPETVGHDVTIQERTEFPGETHLVLDLGAKNLRLAELKLDVPAGVFSRRCMVAVNLPQADGTSVRREIGAATICRVAGDNGAFVASLTIPLHQRIPTAALDVTIANGDSPPVPVSSASATRYPDRLLFFAGKAGSWQLFTGNRHAGAPRYDLAPLRAELTRGSRAPVTPGPLAANRDYQAPAALPDVDPAGSNIDLSGWGRRRPVLVSLPGVVRIELDQAALSHLSRLDLADLRIVQDGRQIPWLREPESRLLMLSPQVTEDPDPKRPAVSRWKVATPHPGLPLHRIEIQSPDPLFSRDLRFLQQGKDELGNPWTRSLTSESWTKAPGGKNAGKSLDVPLGDVRVSNALWIETDNGDNPPIRLENVILRYRAPAVIAKITTETPVFLYYDNPKANPPDYDLDLVRVELLAADKIDATLGNEEVLDPAKQRAERDITAGSPWLWAALAVVVIALLVIVAKLLPKPAAPGTP